jgi:hypothetical protein
MEASDHQNAFWGPLLPPLLIAGKGRSWESRETTSATRLALFIVKKCGVASRAGNVWWSNVGDHLAILAELDERWECVNGDGVAVLDNLR